MMASRQYAANQFGMSNGDPKKKNGGGKSNDNVEVCTEKTAKEGKCGAYAGGGPSRSTGKSVAVKTSSSSEGEANKVLSKKQADKQAVKFEKARAKAPAMKNMTKKQKQAQSEMRPSRQDMAAPKASAKPAAQPKKTKKITF